MSNNTQDQGDTQRHASRTLLDELDSIKELLDDELDNPLPYTSVSDIRSVEEYLRLKQLAAGSGLTIDDYLSQQANSHPDTHPDNVEPEFAIEETDETDETEESDETDEADEADEIIPLDLYHANEDAEVADEHDQQLPDLNGEDAREESTSQNHAKAATTDDVPLLDEVVTADEFIPLLDEVVTPEEAIPLLDEVVTPEEDIPLLDEVVTPEEDIPLLDEVITSEETIPLLDEVVTPEEAIPTPSEIAAQATSDEALSLEELQGLVGLIVERKLERLKPELQREVMAELHKLLSRTTPT